MTPLEMAGLTVFILVLFSGIFLTAFGLPGTVLVLLDAVVMAVLSGFASIGLKVILILFLMSLAAEMLDFRLSRTAGVVRFGFTRLGVWTALAGSLAGAIILTPFLLGLGTLIGIFLGGALMAFVAEMLQRRKLKPPFRIGIGAMLGRMTGVAVKGGVSIAMAAVALFHVYS